MKTIASVAVLPFPLTAAALFGYGILRFLGYINECTHTRFTRVSNSSTGLFGCSGRIINLNCTQLYLKMLEVTQTDKHTKRILTFAVFGDCNESRTKVLYLQLVSALQSLSTTNEARQALEKVFFFINERKIQGWRSVKEIESFVTTMESIKVRSSFAIVYPPDKVFLSLPVFKKDRQTSSDDNVTGSFAVELPEGRIFELCDKHIALAIGGPSGSGKSTIAVSLVEEMRDRIRSLKSRSGFSNLQLSVGLADLDLGTPTTRAIAEGWATDRAKVESLKQPWTMELAERAQTVLLSQRAEFNILICDLPGRVTETTELLAGTADAGILIATDWTEITEVWNPFVSCIGLPVISRIKRREAMEGFSSLVTKWLPGEHLSGRITALNRSQKSWDLFIHWLALFLLFDILPRQFEIGS
jgi:hypothetical protein